jgi:hypothetical protein
MTHAAGPPANGGAIHDRLARRRGLEEAMA